jgi:hypothetical protein
MPGDRIVPKGALSSIIETADGGMRGLQGSAYSSWTHNCDTTQYEPSPLVDMDNDPSASCGARCPGTYQDLGNGTTVVSIPTPDASFIDSRATARADGVRHSK